MDYNTADIREFLMQALSDDDLKALCFDYFRGVHDDFTAGMTRGQRVHLLIEYCERHGVTPNLMAALQRAKPDLYGRRFGQSPEALAEPARLAHDPRQVFVSHAHQDAEFAHRLADDLQRHGWKVWIAPDSIRPGERWVRAINRGLEESGVFVLVLTPAAVNSQWVQDETDAAIELKQQGRARFIPVELEPCRVPPLWGVYQRVPFNDQYEHGRTALLDELEGRGRGMASGRAQSGGVSLSGEQVDVKGSVAGRDQVTKAGGDVVGRDKIAASGPVIVAEPGSTVIVNERDAVAKPPPFPQVISAQQPFDPDLVLIPAGEFLMGSDPAKDKGAYDDEKPQHKLHLPDYYMAKTPVTNGQYLAFVEKMEHGAPGYWKGGKPPKGKESHPVVNITWHDAVAYCRWLADVTGKPYGLPSEAEWEKAARGTDGRIYPWGNDWDVKKCNTSEDGKGDTTPVGAYSGGVSPYGILGMSGNVWEWTRSIFKPYPYKPDDGREDLGAGDDARRVLRGGSWYYGAGLARIGDWYRQQNRPLEALGAYRTGRCRSQADILVERMARVLSGWLNEEGGPVTHE